VGLTASAAPARQLHSRKAAGEPQRPVF